MYKVRLFGLMALVLLTGCINKTVKPDDPYYAPVIPQPTQRLQPVTGSIYNTAVAQNLYGNGRASRVGDIITVTLQESTNSSKSAKTTADKENTITIGAPTIFGKTYPNLNSSLSATNAEFEGEGKSEYE